LGAIVTDNAGQCGRARRILALRWTNIVFVHCFAHAVNNRVKSVLKTSFKSAATAASKVVHTLNASSSKWLASAEECTILAYSKHLSFWAVCDTRWNSVQACFASLLRVKTSLINFCMKWKDDSECPTALLVLGDASWPPAAGAAARSG
jgi:hypothetical protein